MEYVGEDGRGGAVTMAEQGSASCQADGKQSRTRREGRDNDKRRKTHLAIGNDGVAQGRKIAVCWVEDMERAPRIAANEALAVWRN